MSVLSSLTARRIMSEVNGKITDALNKVREELLEADDGLTTDDEQAELEDFLDRLEMLEAEADDFVGDREEL